MFQNDSVQSLLARIIGIIGEFPYHLMTRGRYVPQYFTQDSGKQSLRCLFMFRLSHFRSDFCRSTFLSSSLFCPLLHPSLQPCIMWLPCMSLYPRTPCILFLSFIRSRTHSVTHSLAVDVTWVESSPSHHAGQK